MPRPAKKPTKVKKEKEPVVARTGVELTAESMTELADAEPYHFRLNMNAKYASAAVIYQKPTGSYAADFYEVPQDFVPKKWIPQFAVELRDVTMYTRYGKPLVVATGTFKERTKGGRLNIQTIPLIARNFYPIVRTTAAGVVTEMNLALFEPGTLGKAFMGTSSTISDFYDKPFTSVRKKKDKEAYLSEYVVDGLDAEASEYAAELISEQGKHTKGGQWLRIDPESVAARKSNGRSVDQNTVMSGSARDYSEQIHEEFAFVLTPERRYALERSIIAPFKDAREVGSAEKMKSYVQAVLDKYEDVFCKKIVKELKDILALPDSQWWKGKNLINSNYRWEWLHAFGHSLTPMHSTAETAEESDLADPQVATNLGGADKYLNTRMMKIESLLQWLALNAKDEVEMWIKPVFTMLFDTDAVEHLDFSGLIKSVKTGDEFLLHQSMSRDNARPLFNRPQEYALIIHSMSQMVRGRSPDKVLEVADRRDVRKTLPEMTHRAQGTLSAYRLATARKRAKTQKPVPSAEAPRRKSRRRKKAS